MGTIVYKDKHSMKQIFVLPFHEWLLNTHNYMISELDEQMHNEFLKEYVYDYITEQVDKMWKVDKI
tara:strand:+ start:340 stop:537 length:198 start_codon:yes stop_codon:yes gene_type:complete